jgi:hypothetical protein
VRLKQGERAPADGRWLREEFFLVWWQTHAQLEAQREILLTEVQLLTKDKARLVSEHNAAVARLETERIKTRLLELELERSQKKQEQMWETGSVVRIGAGSVAIGVLLTLIVMGAAR